MKQAVDELETSKQDIFEGKNTKHDICRSKPNNFFPVYVSLSAKITKIRKRNDLHRSNDKW